MKICPKSLQGFPLIVITTAAENLIIMATNMTLQGFIQVRLEPAILPGFAMT
jgi:hypothetical protein